MDYTQFPQIKSADLSSLYDCIPDIWFWVKDVNSTFVWGNEAFLSNYGLSNLSELLGKTDFDFSPFYLAEQFVFDDKAVLEGKSVVNRIEMVNGIGTEVSWHSTTKMQVLDSNSKVLGTMGISRKLTDKQSPDVPIKRLNDIVKYIHANIHLPISVKQMAKILNCAVSTLERTFRKQLHASPMEFIRKIKMQYACNSLINTNTSVFDIAYSLGYADQSHFIREFKRSLKMTPLQYRKNGL